MSIAAAIYMIRCSYHEPLAIRARWDYSFYYGNDIFFNFADHPCVTGEKEGVALPPDQCKMHGFADGRCITTAAGAFRLTKPTWMEQRTKLPVLRDFTPENQDEACRRLLDQIGAASLFESGDVQGGIRLARKRWVMLADRSLDFLLTAYDAGLKGLA